MNIFYIDTSSSYLYLCIQVNDKIIFKNKYYSKDLSKYTMIEIKNIFEEAGILPKDINKIIVVSGPGSFTGIRIGMTFAKIFAWSYKIDITSITSLEAMALSGDKDKIVIPIIDARRGFVYVGVYKNNKSILNDQYIEFTKLKKYLDNLNESYYFITNDETLAINNKKKYSPNYKNIINEYKNKKKINPHLIEPNYFKLTEAEEKIGNNNDH